MFKYQKSYIKLGHKQPGEMNNTEQRYADMLCLKKMSGEIKEYGFGKIKLRIGDKCFYTPDFFEVDAADQLTLVEVKGGFITDDSIVKFKAVGTQYPFIKFKMFQYKNKSTGFVLINEN